MATSLYSLREYQPIVQDLIPPNDPTFLETFKAQTAYSYNPLISTLEAYSKFGGMGKGRLYRDEDYNPFDTDFTGYEGHEQFLIENSANKNHMAHLMTQIDKSNKARETLSRASFLKQIGAGLLDPINLVTLPFGGPTIGFVRSAARVGLGVGAITAVQEAARVPFDPTNQGALEPLMNIGLGIATGAVLGGGLSFIAVTPAQRMKVKKAEDDLRKDIETFASDKTTMNRQEFDQRLPVKDRLYNALDDRGVFEFVKKLESTIRTRTNKIEELKTKIELKKTRANDNPKLKKIENKIDELELEESGIIKSIREVESVIKEITVKVTDAPIIKKADRKLSKTKDAEEKVNLKNANATLKKLLKAKARVSGTLSDERVRAFKTYGKEIDNLDKERLGLEKTLVDEEDILNSVKIEQDLRLMESSEFGFDLMQDQNWFNKSAFYKFVPTPMKTIFNSTAPNFVKKVLYDVGADGGMIANAHKMGLSLGQSVYMKAVPYKGEVYKSIVELRKLWAEKGQKNQKTFLTFNISNGLTKMSNVGRSVDAKDLTFEEFVVNINRMRVMEDFTNRTDIDERAIEVLNKFYNKWEERLSAAGMIGDTKFFKKMVAIRDDDIARYQEKIKDIQNSSDKDGNYTVAQDRYMSRIQKEVLPRLKTERKNMQDAIDSYKDARFMPANESVMHPRYFNKGEIQNNKAKFKKILMDWYRSNPVVYDRKMDGTFDKQIISGEDKLEEYADTMITKLLNDNDELNFDSAYFGQGKSKHLKHRTLDIPNKLVFDFIQQNPVQVMAAYVGRTASAYEFNLKFGGRSYDDLVDQIRDVSFKANKSVEEVDMYVKQLAVMYDRVVGTALKNPDRWSVKIANGLRNAAQLNFLGSAGLSAISEPFKIILENGAGNTLRGFYTGLDVRLGKIKAIKSTEEAMMSGEALDSVFGSVHMRLVDDLTSNPFNNTIWDKAKDGFYILNGLGPITNAFKQWTGIVNQHSIIDQSIKFVDGKATPQERTFLARYGIEYSDAVKIKKLREDGVIEMGERGLYYANTEAWTDEALTSTFRTALSSNIMNTIMMGTPADKPILVDGISYIPMRVARKFGLKEDERVAGYSRIENGLMGLPFQFYSYSLAAVNKVNSTTASGQSKSKAMAVLTAISLAYFGQYARTPSYVWDQLETSDKVARAVDYSGLASLYSGLFYEGMHSSLALGGPDISGGLLQPKVPDVENKGLSNTVGLSGAGPSWFYDFATSSFELAFDKKIDYSEGVYQFVEGDRGNALKRLMRSLPFARIPWWKNEVYQLTNAIDRNVD